MSLPVCNIRFCRRNPASWILAGFKLLENEGILKLGDIEVYNNFFADAIFSHNNIVEAEIDGRIIVFDYGNGYQSFLRPEAFDKNLDRVHAYFKSNFDAQKHIGLRNQNKIYPFIAGHFDCTCKRNPYDFILGKGDGKQSVKELLNNLKIYASVIKNESKRDYRTFEAFNSFDSYDLLFWTRINPTTVTPKEAKNVYTFLSDDEAIKLAESWSDMLAWVNNQRLAVYKQLKDYFGDRLIGGIADGEYARQVCPELITHDERIEQKSRYIKTTQGNIVGIITKGHQYCVGARCGELLAAGRAILSDPFFYELPHGFDKDKNYVEFADADSVCDTAEKLLKDVDRIHGIEKNNREYYREHFRPQASVLDVLKTALPETFGSCTIK